MLVANINSKDTVNEDKVIISNNGFPIVYAGRGCYSGQMKIWSFCVTSSTEQVHLIYIGRYTSIGENLSIYCDMGHDYNSVYMGLIHDYADESEGLTLREQMGQVETRMHRKGMTVIGNDVWIGDNVTIISDVVIGNGAVIGAGSVVAHDIPPYTIYAGNPAVHIRDRFSKHMIDGMQKISWWNFNRERLKEIKDDMKGEAEDFVAKFEPLAIDYRSDNRERIFGMDKKTIVLTFLDIESEYPVFSNIIMQFYALPVDPDTAMIICYHMDNECENKVIDSLSELIDELSDRSDIRLLGIKEEDTESIISNSDYLVLGRDIRNIQRISYALKYNVKLLSGVNKPIFHKSLRRY